MKNIGNSLWKKDPFPNLAESLILMGLTALIVGRHSPHSHWHSSAVNRREASRSKTNVLTAARAGASQVLKPWSCI